MSCQAGTETVKCQQSGWKHCVCVYRAMRRDKCPDTEETVGDRWREDSQGEVFLLLPVPHVPDDHQQSGKGEYQGQF